MSWTIMKFIFWISPIITLALICCESYGLTVSSSYHPIFQGIRLKCGEICSKVAFHIFTLVRFNKRINHIIVKVGCFYVLQVSKVRRSFVFSSHNVSRSALSAIYVLQLFYHILMTAGFSRTDLILGHVSFFRSTRALAFHTALLF